MRDAAMDVELSVDRKPVTVIPGTGTETPGGGTEEGEEGSFG